MTSILLVALVALTCVGFGLIAMLVFASRAVDDLDDQHMDEGDETVMPPATGFRALGRSFTDPGARGVVAATRTIAWLTLVLVAVLTLIPVEYTPRVGDILLQNFVAFAALGLLFGAAYARQLLTVGVALIGFGVVLELGQEFTFDRQGRFVDVLAKVGGTLTGLLAARFILTAKAR